MIATEKKPFVPKYKALVSQYEQAILTHEFPPGTRVDSINEIQNRHHVSRETAKLVLRVLAKNGYIVQRPGKGSFVADIRPKKNIWGVILPFYSAQYEDLLQCLLDEASRLGRELHHFVDYNNWEEEIRLVGALVNQRYEAVIVVPTLDESKTTDFYSRLSPKETYVTLLDHSMSGSFFSYVIQSYDLGVKRAMNYLLEKGNGPIAFVKNEVWEKRNMVNQLMEGTYRQIVQEKLPSHPPILVNHVNHVDASLYHHKKVRGIFCCDDSDAVKVIGKLKEKGIRIPGHMHLVSYGNTHLSRYFIPGITSVDPHNQEMTQTISRILEKRRKGESTQYSQYVVQPELVARDT